MIFFLKISNVKMSMMFLRWSPTVEVITWMIVGDSIVV